MNKLFSGLEKTRANMTAGGDWRERLLMCDVGAATADAIIGEITVPLTAANIANRIRRRLRRLEAMLATEGRAPFVILLIGVNGCGKTTTLAKLARRFLAENKRVLLAAGDTFRAAAREQLEKWAATLGGEADIIGGTGDPAAVAFNAVTAGLARRADVVLIDTAGRLPTRAPLMAELAKIRRAINKALPGAPHELLLVLDATTGQNALTQIRAFSDAVGVTGVIVTKLDGSSKGGFLLAMADDAPTPVRFVGVGEKGEDLAIFNADEYADALVGATAAVAPSQGAA